MALGPTSTPRRSCPRSIGTPRTPTGRRAFSGPASGKGHAAGAAGGGGGPGGGGWGVTHGVDPAKEHRGLVVGEYLLVAREIGFLRPGLVGEEATLGVQTRGVDRGFQRQAAVHHVN